MDQSEEKIVMTPLKREVGLNVLLLERVDVSQMDSNRVIHEAGGNHKGIVINKQAANCVLTAPQASLSFKVFMVNAATNSHTKESRHLKFWFKNVVAEEDRMQRAQTFFRSLVNPSEFPEDYIRYIMKIMKLMQHQYKDIMTIEVEIKQLEQIEEPPSRPFSVDDNSLGVKKEVSIHKILEVIESCYPNAISLSGIATATQASEEEAYFFVSELLSKNVIKAMDNNTFMRITQNDTQVKLVKQMPKVVRSQQPTIAIITAQYAEKLAVDAMIDNKDTYVRYKTEGESNVYTLGNIGWHRVVSTKLPAVGHSRGAMIAAGNTTTRLLGKLLQVLIINNCNCCALGSFQRVEYVFMVGVGGGVPHYTDYKKHVRLGDVVVSAPPPGTEKPYIYIHFEELKNSPEERTNGANGHISSNSFSCRTWCPPNLELQEVSQRLWEQGSEEENNRIWEQYIKDGLSELDDQEADFTRPAPESDKLYMSIGTKDLIEVGHPQPRDDEYNPRAHGMPMVHFGAIASGRVAVNDEQIRQDIANKYEIKAFDTEFDAVAESVYGNRKERYAFIRGICDYKDGTRKKEWQPCAALNAAAFMKAVIMNLSPMTEA
ncbi:uncharacterized protein B4U80_03213 [Leptotrombidium deliense]|uniref:Winged helix-turn-helix domain-containing protein n=1 Tax=Leptotrombidium deliense TaxID=299467 RepID=A0A443STB9_9ACAR|nr:uncharacterized protein B4U80_03213 [Leptotrombidium deliense]